MNAATAALEIPPLLLTMRHSSTLAIVIGCCRRRDHYARLYLSTLNIAKAHLARTLPCGRGPSSARTGGRHRPFLLPGWLPCSTEARGMLFLLLRLKRLAKIRPCWTNKHGRDLLYPPRCRPERFRMVAGQAGVAPIPAHAEDPSGWYSHSSDRTLSDVRAVWWEKHVICS